MGYKNAHEWTRFFAQKEIVWGNILIVDSLMKMGWSLVNRYNICKDGEKLANHILIHCDKIGKFLDIIVNNFWFGLGIPRFNEKPSPKMEI